VSTKSRRTLTRIYVAVSAVILLALLISAPLRHHAWYGGWTIIVPASISVACGLYYLHSMRGGAQ
jgi:hypothetical protein